MEEKKRALILYATMTGNTEKIAAWFKETFEFYRFETTMVRMASTAEWKEMQNKLYFDDYDVVCLGSPIVAGAPLQIVIKSLSLGGGGQLENAAAKNVAEKNIEANLAGASEGHEGEGPGAGWRREAAPYMGVMREGQYQPLGIVFTTYGGGFYGSEESRATLETLKLYLELNNVAVVGTFACCGKESGPAGYADGDIPRTMDPTVKLESPKIYTDAEGGQHYGSFFFHSHMNDKPGPRDEAKAKALVADLVEDYFFSHDGKRKRIGSQYVSIS